ncbi:MAG: hypothetical protein BWK80_31540 [Desulfobacteraceae bacterium IS3]|jgi:hypothetical protein|nr:MAG: hypothetical protein BWK80_31540 [Desulfobacteraceae bacterium IS3]HAO19412.1 hypothetical protein [Desulfobacteraceae bacterium]
MPINIIEADSDIITGFILKEASAKDEIIRKHIINKEPIFSIFFITAPPVRFCFSSVLAFYKCTFGAKAFRKHSEKMLLFDICFKFNILKINHTETSAL